ncbi:MAG: uroporphyrinogen-III synthase [Melioribacteraceae bacterium]|jgi:uroporphyrinogen-III synthase|nr:uroporphyrinogen-III synthase [Melioribacteraceae bacterium]
MNADKINILFTGLSGNDSALQNLSNSDKVNLIHFPTIEISETILSIEEKDKINIADDYNYLIFTSINAVKYFLLHYRKDYSKLNCKAKIVAIGEKTTSLLLNNNIDVDLIPSNSSSGSIDKLLTNNLVNQKSILIPGSSIAKSDLFNSLESKGALVDFIAVYKNMIPKNISDSLMDRVRNTNFNLFVYTSPSTFYNFVSLFKIDNVQNYFSNKLIATIGPVTTEAIKKQNLIVNIEPNEYNLSSLTKNILDYYKLN